MRRRGPVMVQMEGRERKASRGKGIKGVTRGNGLKN